MLITKMITVGLGSRSSVEITRERGGFTFKIALVLLKRLTWVHLTFEIDKNNIFIPNESFVYVSGRSAGIKPKSPTLKLDIVKQ